MVNDPYLVLGVPRNATQEEIKKAPAGVPQIEVTFDIDANGILKVSAKDLDTGKEQSITITDNERMSDEEIEQAIRDAEQYAAADQTRREAMNIHNEAAALLNRTQTALEQAKKEKKDIYKEEKKQIKEDMAGLRKAVSKIKPEKATEQELADIRNSMRKLEQSSAALLQATDDSEA